MCTGACRGVAHRWDYGRHFRVGLLAMNYMFDLMGGMQMRHWVVQPKFTQKQTIDNAARSAGYQFIRVSHVVLINVRQTLGDVIEGLLPPEMKGKHISSI